LYSSGLSTERLDLAENDDISPIVEGWPYHPRKISARKILGDDGLPKVQMRLDLGLIQMELVGRPDGVRPNDHESLLECYANQLTEYKLKHGSDLGFELSPTDCRELRDEALMYYHRYLACFVLEEYEQVIQDTQRNLQVFDLCNRYAAKKSDRMILEQYRPYVIMMNTRAKAQLAAKHSDYSEAIKQIKAGLRAIKKIYDDIDQPEEFQASFEASILRQLGRRMRRKLPADPLKTLEKKLLRAVNEDRFEDAAHLRDQIARIKKAKDAEPKGDQPTDRGQESQDG
jgi:hypothetical protein